MVAAANCEDKSVWGKTGAVDVTTLASDCASEAALIAVNFGLSCEKTATLPELHALRAKCPGIISDLVGKPDTRAFGHAAAVIIVDAAWILISIALFLRKLFPLIEKDVLRPRVVPVEISAALSIFAVIAVATPLRDGSCFRGYADGTFAHNGDGFIPDVDEWSGPVLWTAMAAAAIPIYTEATETKYSWLSTVGYIIMWSLTYITNLEHARDVCPTTYQGLGAVAAKLCATGVVIIMTIDELHFYGHIKARSERRVSPNSSPYRPSFTVPAQSNATINIGFGKFI